VAPDAGAAAALFVARIAFTCACLARCAWAPSGLKRSWSCNLQVQSDPLVQLPTAVTLGKSWLTPVSAGSKHPLRLP